MSSNASAFLYIGLDLDETYLKAILCDPTGQVVAQRRQAAQVSTAESIINQIVSVVKEFQSLEGEESILGVGLAVSGFVNLKTGQIEMNNSIPNFSSVDIYNAIFQETKIQIVVDSHSNVACYGEWQSGIGQGFNSIFYIDIGQTLSSAFVINGQLWRGNLGFAGAIGFLNIDLDNERTLDSTVSGNGILRRIQQRLHKDRTSSLSRLAIPQNRELLLEDVINSARAGDELAQVVIERTGLYLGVGLAGIISLLNPELVIIGGIGILAGELLMRPAMIEIEKRASDLAFKNCRIVASPLGINASTIGAALLARDSLTSGFNKN